MENERKSLEGTLENLTTSVAGLMMTEEREKKWSSGDCLVYHTQMIEKIMKSPGNEIMFLPTGLGDALVVDSVISQTLKQVPDKHVVICVLRPAQALTYAQRLRRNLRVAVGAYCGGDFLYDFEKEFASNTVLVFTAGLLMRLAKLGVYKLSHCSLLVLHDAFHAVRNHPMNTLVREYYWKNGELNENKEQIPGVNRPKILGTISPQTQNLQRPFDKLRQMVRKLAHSLQAGIILPTGPALEALASRVHHAHLTVHAYATYPQEAKLAEMIQKHLLHVWDVLHPQNQNHFGRLIHFPSLQDSAANSTGESKSKTEQTASERETLVENPFHHDWHQITLMIESSIECTLGLPIDGATHCRSDVAVMIMQHVKDCIQALTLCMEEGTVLASKVMFEALEKFKKNLKDLSNASGLNEVDKALTEGGVEAISTSPLLQPLVDNYFQQDLALKTFQEPFEIDVEISSRMKMFLSVLRATVLYQTHEAKSQTICVVVNSKHSIEVIIGAMAKDPDLASIEYQIMCPLDCFTMDQGTRVVFMYPDCFGMTDCRSAVRRYASDVIWFEAMGVMHAAAFDFGSTALCSLRKLCGVGDELDATFHQGPNCRIIATNEQTAAWLEICRADQLLLAASQLVQSGDASLEERLSQLATKKSMAGSVKNDSNLALAVPPPSTTLHTLCLGLCGDPPVFNLHRIEETQKNHHDARYDELWQATAVLPDMLVAGIPDYTTPLRRGTYHDPFVGQLASSGPEARDAAAEAALASLVANGTVSAYWHTRILAELFEKISEMKWADEFRAIQAPRIQNGAPDVPISPFLKAGLRQSNDIVTSSDNERLICSICGIVTTSEAHLAEHQKGRRHQKNLERIRLQQNTLTAAAHPDSDAKQAETDWNEDPIDRKTSEIGRRNTIDQLPSTLSDALVRRSSSMVSQASTSIYEGFPCVRVGDVVLPSSMDLRAFLDEMQHAEDRGQENKAKGPEEPQQKADTFDIPQHSATRRFSPNKSKHAGHRSNSFSKTYYAASNYTGDPAMFGSSSGIPYQAQVQYIHPYMQHMMAAPYMQTMGAYHQGGSPENQVPIMIPPTSHLQVSSPRGKRPEYWPSPRGAHQNGGNGRG